MIEPGKEIHFVGIGGIGMSALAQICQARGLRVSGCDSRLSDAARRLQTQEISVALGHEPSHVHDDVGLVVYSSAVKTDQPELREARRRGVPIVTRGELLAALARSNRLIAVAGSHGKTTTTAMATHLLIQAGWDPTAVVGGVVRTLGSNARCGRGRYLVAETDESDGSFLLLHPEVAIVTNIDQEHLNHYGDFGTLLGAFQQFVRNLTPEGLLIRCDDDPWVRRLPRRHRQLTYGFDPNADVTAGQVQLQGAGTTFHPRLHGRGLGTFALQVPGRHNVLNALGVIALGMMLELPLVTMREALAAFRGVQRRFELVRLPHDVWFVEDYAHHPSEIRATLEADSTRDRYRLVVFQPHRFTRTQRLEREFAACFDRADGVIVTDIYSAFEPPIPGVSGSRLAELIKAHGHPCVRYVPRGELSAFVRQVAHPGETVFFLGAGDIGEVCHVVADRLRATTRAVG